eukprot:TRINITY_DN19152_c0_g1_i3.p1 TRINITY_DN19152_c0_g1~~TRINITY_DN19152_c0_g1_i3.p1  ORF type:complete len:115 (+),score=41.07 TRINITY_DN19152_c0_g1_i3:140-484(+)
MCIRDSPPLRPGYKRLKVDDFLPPHMNPYGEGAVMDIVDEDFVGSDAASSSFNNDDEDDIVERYPHGAPSSGGVVGGGGKQGGKQVASSSGRVDTVSGLMTEGDSYFVYCPSTR